MTQITIRGLEPELEAAVRRLAEQTGLSLNKAALALLRKGANLPAPGSRGGIGDALDDWMGHMSEADARAINDAVEELDRRSLDHE